MNCLSQSLSSDLLIQPCVRHPLQNCKKWVSPPPRRAPRCSAAPVMGSLKASRLLSIPHLSPDPRIRSASPASSRVRWDVCFSLFLFFCFSSPQDMITPLAGINLFSNATWQPGLQSLPDPFLGVWWVFLHKGGLRDTVGSVGSGEGDHEAKGLMESSWFITCLLTVFSVA